MPKAKVEETQKVEQKAVQTNDFESEVKELAYSLVKQQKQNASLFANYRQLLTTVITELELENVETVEQIAEEIRKLKGK